MKLGRCKINNFGSYQSFDFDFGQEGLSLGYGATGSGKSTIPDISCWMLFGITAKDGAADDVRSWHTPNESTSGTLEVSLPTGDITITRIRGKANQNDLFWTDENSEEPKRGKDLTETQKKLEALLGFNSDTYIASAYFHEFNPTGSFFVAKAKDRRQLFEKLANLELPRRLAESTTHEKKSTKAEIEETKLNLSRTAGQLTQLANNIESGVKSLQKWDQGRAAELESINKLLSSFDEDQWHKITGLSAQSSTFESSRNSKIDSIVTQLEGLDRDILPDVYFEEHIASIRSAKANQTSQSDICPTCGTALGDCEDTSFQDAIDLVKDQKRHNQNLKLQHSYDIKELKRLQGEVNPYTVQMNEEMHRANPYYDQLNNEKTRINPFRAQVAQDSHEFEQLEIAEKRTAFVLDSLETHLSDLSFLYDISSNLRGELLKQAVKAIETATNNCLDTHFDAEIRVSFLLTDADNLDVEIQKSGHSCNYKQLSKGQRGLLKLAFTTSVMAAASDRAGVHFSNLAFDEALDGLDSNMKVQAFGLLQELSLDHESILVIDHDLTFQSLFERKFKVTMIDDISHIEEELES
jgi:DNA repair exonuclease SbcCD ATPase subunit